MKKFLWISIIIFASLFILWACREAPTLSKIDEENDSPLFSDSLKASISNLEGRNQNQNPKNSNPDVVALQTESGETCEITPCPEETRCDFTCLGEETCRTLTCEGNTCEGLTCWETCGGPSCRATDCGFTCWYSCAETSCGLTCEFTSCYRACNS